MKRISTALGCSIALLAAGCATSPPQNAPVIPAAEPPAPTAASTPPPGIPLAKVGDELITVEEFGQAMAARGGRNAGQFSSVEQRRALLDEMIRQRAVLAAARQSGFDQDPDYRAAVDRMLEARYLDATLDQKMNAIDTTPAEVTAYYEAHRQDFLTPERRRPAWIFLSVSAKADAAQEKKIRARIEEARTAVQKLPAGTAGLADLARTYSEDTSTRYTGGELGWLYLDQAPTYRWGEELVKQVFALPEAGAISPVYRHEKGFYFLKLVSIEEAQPTPLEKLRAGIRSRILTEKRAAAKEEFYRDLLAGREIRIDQEKLRAIDPLQPAPTGEQAPPPLPN
ncbi:MAG: peptidyl-prolyl cis-trans isomerase [Thermoanaerobaculia bacterium]